MPMTDSTPPRQTLSFLRRRFEETGIRPHTRLGQNFLIDLNLLGVLVEAATIEPNDVVLEVGTGTGSLTAQLAQRAAAVVTVEVDPAMFQLACEQLHQFDNVTMLHLDALKNKNRLNPAMLEAVAGPTGRGAGPAAEARGQSALQHRHAAVEQPAGPGRSAADDDRHDPEGTGPADHRPAGLQGLRRALSVWVQSQCRVEILRILPPEVFWPRPKVSSAFIQITLDDELRRRIPDRAFFHVFVRAMFLHRRKFLRSQLLAAVGGRLGKPEVDAVLARLNLDGTLRAEQLDVDTMLALSEAVRA